MQPRLAAAGFVLLLLTSWQTRAADDGLDQSLSGWVSGSGVADGDNFARQRVFGGLRGHLSATVRSGDVTGRVTLEAPTSDTLGSQDLAVIVREGWVRYMRPAFDVTIGRQFLPEGRSDRLRPQDQFAPRDLTQVTTLDAEQRFGLPAARLDYYFGNTITLTAAYIVQDHGYVLPDKITRQLPGGQTLANDPVQAGLLQVTWRPGEWELAASISRGASPLSALTLAPGSVRQAIQMQTRLAIDGTYTLGGNLLRWDIAGIADDAMNLPGVEREGIFASLGWDHNVWTDGTVSVQVLHREAALGAVDPALAPLARANRELQQTIRRSQTWLTLSLKQRWRESQDFEAGGLIGEAGEYAGYLAWRWRPVDQWQLAAQVQGATGPAGSLSATVLPSARAFVEIRYSF